MKDDTGRQLAKSIVQSLGDAWMSWIEQPLGSVWQNAQRADVLSIAKSYSPFVVRIYEVKISRGDFQNDVFLGKYKGYLPFCHYFYFATPQGLIKKEEVPEGCGLITYGEKGWRSVKAPVKRDINISQDFFLSLLMKGYQDSYERYRDLENKRIDKTWNYPGFAAAANEFGLKLSYDVTHSKEYVEHVAGLKKEIETISKQKFQDMESAFGWMERGSGHAFKQAQVRQ